ncbi:unnamed protein product [Phyllotreta striolata]|uniref:tRNA/rRNA methyltransferase SpoU type domain-containing protein n=1 Tax=Phyllotreta striolata TaxID=444603 RepID=A0A9N9TY62_PHYSR|nr:unnamed protein product [Phyllotreta striolata]
MFNRITLFIFSKNVKNANNNTRLLSRWVSRKPVRVISSEDYNEEEDGPIIKPQEQEKPLLPRNSKPLTISKRSQAPKITLDMLETTIDEAGNFIYTKMKDQDTRVTSILTQIKSQNVRDKKDLILLEGKRLIKDALDANCKLEYILFSRFKEVEYLRPSLPKVGANLYKMPYKEIQMWSNLTTSPGIMGIFKVPDVENHMPARDSIPLTVICDNVREADNLGAIMRTCHGVGCKEILLTKGCVNVWDSKVLRSACGAHFKLRIQKQFDWNCYGDFIPPNSNVFVADNRVISLNTIDEKYDEMVLRNVINSIPVIPYYSANFSQAEHNVLIVGGETEGVSEQSYKLVSQMKGTRLNIPLGNDVDSLNVGTALGILVFEIKRQFMLSK